MLLRDDAPISLFPYIYSIPTAPLHHSASPPPHASYKISPKSSPKPARRISNRNLIILWCAPRSVSTAFERAFISHPTTHALHEPFSIPYHFGPNPDRLCPRFEQKCNASFWDIYKEVKSLTESAPANQLKNLKSMQTVPSDDSNINNIFIKELAYCVTERCGGTKTGTGSLNPTEMTKLLRPITHNTFIIRNPNQQILSLYRQMRRAHPTWELTAQNLWEESGVGQLFQLFLFVRQQNETTVVVDADDLREDPERVIRRYCEEVGVEFSEGMLEWEEGMPEQWKVWGDRGWHDVAVKSTGIGKVEKKQEEEEEVPGYVREVVERCMPIYRQMWESRIRVSL
ncbi:hypothetical protein HK097_004346 [Rhizophlyctis rosea]|uniref:P-loop containing nucleoside triphosphate hydrolase protein n=1 Tax=Rhizophlyctis rosea TaxID=64517 RepID=A0AAD5SJE5_9FUNG|nr:hypothetical protein HK097_004346 [Rhizophlyctis rosea]